MKTFWRKQLFEGDGKHVQNGGGGEGEEKPVISYYCQRIHSSGLDFKLPLVKGDYLSSSCFTPGTTTLSPNYCQLVNGYTTPGVPLREQTSHQSSIITIL